MGYQVYRGGWAAPIGGEPSTPVDAAHLAGHGGELAVTDAQIRGERVGPPPELVSDAQADAYGWGARSGYVPGAPVDGTPEGHDQGVADPGQACEPRADAAANRARSTDMGAVRRQRYGAQTMVDASETRTTERRQLPYISDGSTAQLRLKQLSRPENTVDSRLGYDVFQWIERKFRYRWRRTDVRPVGVSVAASAADSPPLKHSNQYTSPFSTLGMGRVRNMMTPMIRRIPRPFDELVITDGTDGVASPTEYLPWGL